MPYSSRSIKATHVYNQYNRPTTVKQQQKQQETTAPRHNSKPIVQDIKLVRAPSRPNSRPQG